MRLGEELHQFSNGDFIWQRYDPAVKADLFSTGLATAAGTYLIDPIALAERELSEALGGSKAVGIVVTNANHVRAAVIFSRNLSAGVYARAGAFDGITDAEVSEVTAGADQLTGLEIIAIEGAAAGEIALFRADSPGGTVVIGDAVINSGSYGFTLLPAKYCSNPKLLRKSLHQLLDYSFERIFFAHGMPIVARGRSRLAALLDLRSE